MIKALHGTPIQAIAAPGANLCIHILGYSGVYVYGGSNVFVAAAAQNITLTYAPVTGVSNVITTGILTGTTSTIVLKQDTNISASPVSDYSNVAITFYNTSATEISGNAANDNVVNWSITYTVVPT